MRRIVLHMMMSVDGFVASSDGDESWMVPDPQRDEVSLVTANAVEAALIGHGVYGDMVGYWPTAEGETETQRAYIARINPMPKLVVTGEPDGDLQWNASALVVGESGLAARIRELKAGDGGDIVVWGGARLVQQLVAADLIDEYQLIVQPITLGSGVGLFAATDDRVSLRLLEVRGFDTGAMFARYAPGRGSGDEETS